MVDNQRASSGSIIQSNGTGFGGLFGDIGNFFAPKNAPDKMAAAGVGDAASREKTVDEQYRPSLDFAANYKDKHVIVTGASGAIGTELVLKLYKAGVARMVLFVKDIDHIDRRVLDIVSNSGGAIITEECDLREPPRILMKFEHCL